MRTKRCLMLFLAVCVGLGTLPLLTACEVDVHDHPAVIHDDHHDHDWHDDHHDDHDWHDDHHD